MDDLSIHECFYRKNKEMCLHPKITSGGFIVNKSKSSIFFCTTCQYKTKEAYTQPVDGDVEFLIVAGGRALMIRCVYLQRICLHYVVVGVVLRIHGVRQMSLFPRKCSA